MIFVNFKTSSGSYSMSIDPKTEDILLYVSSIDGTVIYNEQVQHLGNHLPRVVRLVGVIDSYDINMQNWTERVAEESSNLDFLSQFLNNRLVPAE